MSDHNQLAHKCLHEEIFSPLSFLFCCFRVSKGASEGVLCILSILVIRPLLFQVGTLVHWYIVFLQGFWVWLCMVQDLRLKPEIRTYIN